MWVFRFLRREKDVAAFYFSKNLGTYLEESFPNLELFIRENKDVFIELSETC